MHPRLTISLLGVSFLAYSFSIYLQPTLDTATPANETNLTAEGRLVWQKYNCQSCHQLYGLGGYLGPDLTNVMSAPNKGVPLLRALLKAPTPPMPVYNLSETETDALVAFLTAMDASGSSSPKNFTILPTGMIQPK
ncbi:MAG: c-type cytochrome [Saprospiraceae bacterium]|nr:c-type cytochrome [Saprospiraceae bacterium]